MTYWETRALELEQQTTKKAITNYQTIEKAFSKAEAEIKAKIENWYNRLAKNNNLELEDAKRLLKEDELKEFKWTLDDYIEYGKKNGLNQEWMKELENASAKYHINRLQAELINIRAEYEKAFQVEQNVISKTVGEAYTDRYDHMAFEIQKGLGVGYNPSGKNSEQVQKLIKKPWASDGSNFSDRIWTKKDQMVDMIQGELIRSLLTGGNTEEAISIMTHYIKNDVKNAKYSASRLIRTESAHFASVGQKDCFGDLGVEKYEVLAVLDSKTSAICQGMDGQIFEMKDWKEGVTAPPFHVNCRSTTAPYFDDNILDLSREVNYKGETFKIPSGMTFKEWKAKQDEIIEKSKEIQYNDITDKWQKSDTKGKYEEPIGVTIDGKTYNVGDNGVTLNLENRPIEKEIAQILSDKYGRKVQILPEISGDNRHIPMADLMVDGKLIEIKTIKGEGKNTVKHAFQNAEKQANSVIINVANEKLDINDIIEKSERIMNGNQCGKINSCIIMKDGEIVKAIERKKIGTALLQKQEVIPIVNNTTTKQANSQAVITQNNMPKDLNNTQKDDKIKNKFTKAKSIKEAEKYAKDVLGIENAYYDKIDLEVANELNESIFGAIKEHEGILNDIKAIGDTQENNRALHKELFDLYNNRLIESKGIDANKKGNEIWKKAIDSKINGYTPKVSSSELACTIKYGLVNDVEFNNILLKHEGVFINNLYGSNINLLKKSLQYNVDSKASPIGCNTIKSLFDHELGHKIDNLYNLKDEKEVKDLWDEFNKLSLNERTDALSKYAFMNTARHPIKEFIAEAYSEYKNNPNPRKFAEAIGEIIAKKKDGKQTS